MAIRLMPPNRILLLILLPIALHAAWSYFKFKVSGTEIQDSCAPWKFWVKRSQHHLFLYSKGKKKPTKTIKSRILEIKKNSAVFGLQWKWSRDILHRQNLYRIYSTVATEDQRIRSKSTEDINNPPPSLLISSEGIDFRSTLPTWESQWAHGQIPPHILHSQPSRYAWSRSYC